MGRGYVIDTTLFGRDFIQERLVDLVLLLLLVSAGCNMPSAPPTSSAAGTTARVRARPDGIFQRPQGPGIGGRTR